VAVSTSRRPAALRRGPLLAGAGVALIGLGVGALVAWGASGNGAVPLTLAGVGAVALALHLARASAPAGSRAGRPRIGWLLVLDFDFAAAGLLTGAWGAAGGTRGLAIGLGAVALAMAGVGYVCRRYVLTAFLHPGSSPLGVALALLPAIAAGGGAGFVLGRGSGALVPAIVMVAIALYLVLFAQAAVLRLREPGWQPPAQRRGARRRRDQRRR
jgi:hypothetical protein